MMDSFSLLWIAATFFVVAVTPGPANISNAIVAMSKGRKTSLIYGLGLSSGLVFWGLVAASGLGVALQSSLYLLFLLKILGGLYLLWLAYSSAKSAMENPRTLAQTSSADISYKGWFIRGFILNISNPKTVIAWMAALSMGISSDDGVRSIFMGVLACVLVGFLTNAMYSLAFSSGNFMNMYQRASRSINIAVSALFAIAGLGLIRSAYNQGATP